jgi:hypothetical protein
MYCTAAKFIVPGWGDKVDSGMELARDIKRLPSKLFFLMLRKEYFDYPQGDGTTTLRRSRLLLSPSRDYEFVYRTIIPFYLF